MAQTWSLPNYARRQPNALPGAQTGPVSTPASSTWPPAAAPIAGYALGGGTLVTGVTAATFYDDNIFATRSARQSDVAFVGRPEFAWMAQGQNYTIGADGYIEGRRYVKYNSEDQVNGSFGVNFTVMPDTDTQIVSNARYLHAHLDRGSSDTVGPGGILLSTAFQSPIAYDQGIGSIALNKRYGQWWTSLGAAGVGIHYDNASLLGGIVDFSYADGGIGVANGRLGYVIAPLTSVFVEAAGNVRNWRVDVFDSTGYRVVGGVLFEQGPNARLRGEAWAGYMNQQYNGVSFQEVSNWTYGASMAFLLTDQLTGVIEGRREAKEAALSLALIAPGVLGASAAVCSTSPGAACVSAIESTIAGRLEYRILANVAIGAGASYMVDDYLGPVAGHRSDRTLSPLASLKYFPNDKVTLSFDYRRINFDPVGGQSAGVGAISYDRDVYLLSMNGRF
ncbi:MAG TPA: outer membrane beta-barrel protein [Rhodopseudomonas sp.]|uniref:outer membrane beta-barrel protein n=1 Tax=Rhodopseudomonas sp. TaxID=1078 RepID=UPI002ED7B250